MAYCNSIIYCTPAANCSTNWNFQYLHFWNMFSYYFFIFGQTAIKIAISQYLICNYFISTITNSWKSIYLSTPLLSGYYISLVVLSKEVMKSIIHLKCHWSSFSEIWSVIFAKAWCPTLILLWKGIVGPDSIVLNG